MHFLKTLTVLSVWSMLGLSVAVMAQDAPQEATVTMSSYAFAPQNLVLKVGVPAHLHLVNSATKGHNFAAPEFFAAATVADADQAKVKKGEVEVKEGESVDLTVTPTKPGTYPLECTHFLHASMGMKGSITVE